MNSKLNQSEGEVGPACSVLTHAGRMSPNSQVLGYRTVPSTSPFTGNQSQVVTQLLTN